MSPAVPQPASLTVHVAVAFPSVTLTSLVCPVSFLRQNTMQRHSKKCDTEQEKPAPSGKGKGVKRKRPAASEAAAKGDGTSFQTNGVLIGQ